MTYNNMEDYNMTWQSEMTLLVRGLIGDITSPYAYSDNIITEYLIYAAHFNIGEITFETTFTIDIVAQIITPNPITPTRYTLFINLTCMRAALLILGGEIKIAASNAVSVKDGPSELNFTKVYSAKNDLYNQMQKDFDKAKMAAMIGDLSVGLSILGPYTQESISEVYRSSNV
jgi:hypothetical protein